VKSWQIATSILGSITTIYVSWEQIHILRKKQEAFRKAKSLTSDKGIINLGAGPHRSFFAQRVIYSPEVVANVDIAADGVPRYIQLDLEQPLPFREKQFDVALMSHSLEHLSNWQLAFDEARRVADCVVIALPHPFSLSGQLHPGHWQHFSFSDMQRLKSYPGVFVFY